MVLESCDGASSGDSVTNAANTGDFIVSNRGRGDMFVVTCSEPANTTVLGTGSFPACAEIGDCCFLWWYLLLLLLLLLLQ